MDSSQPSELQDQVVVPEVVKKPRIPPFFVSPKGDWKQLVALAKLVAPSFQSQMSGRFLKVTVGDELEYRNLSRWLEQSGVEFKSFMLKQDRPVKVVIRGLPSNTEPEDIKNEIEAEGFKVAKISQMKNYRTKAPMPLFYLQIENGADAPKIFNFTELFGTRIEVKPFDRGNKINQCWRCQGWFHSSEVCHLPPRCVRCAGPHLAKDCTRAFDEPLRCANCSGEHAANWSRCPKHPKNAQKKNPNRNNKNKNGPKPKINLNQKKVPQDPRPDISKARKVSPNLNYSKVVQNQIPREHIKSKIHQRNRLRKFWQRSRCPSIYSEFRTLSREIAKDIKSHSQAQWEKHIEALSPEDNTLWRKSSHLRKPFHAIPPLKGALGSTAITPIEKAEVIADSLQEQFEPNHVADREVFDQRIHEEVANFLATPHVQEIEPTTPTEVLTYVQRIKPKKSPDLIKLLIQCGFRPKCSTVHQLLRVTELIHSGFAKHEATGILFLDIAKAFDKIWHDGLLIKLIRLDFPAPLINPFTAFFPIDHSE
ncbi:nucleic-acid-binding protein from transposon X-element [Trichonephila clavipes]|nr:nucleic-acid-binding protein from transposon X-element [Trichonephila clavipes]